MNKPFKILGVLSMSFVLLSGCGNDTNSSSNEKSNDKEHSSSTKKEIKKVEFSKYINNSEHVFYKINTGSMITNDMIADGNEHDGISIKDLGETTVDNSSILKNIIATKDGQTRDFNIDFSKNETYNFKSFSKYKGSELTNKLIKAETKQGEDSNNSEASAFVNPKQLLFTEKDKPDRMYFQFNNDTSIADEKEEIKKHGSSYNSYNTSIKPFKYNDKYYSGLADAHYNEEDGELTVNHILITEIANKNQQIVLDNKEKFNDDEIIRYEDTDKAKKEQEKEENNVDNL